MELPKSSAQYRAHIHLFPHAPSPTKSTTVPGEFPSSNPTHREAPKEFPRELILTPEKPTQPIGRSSSNKSKGLFAAKNNAFFDSPVMSRAHAEVKMVLEPVRKVIIKDSNSMHGTFVNGLQLARNETAELRDGTELTFGADVTRADEIHPARTFRCAVHWEEKRVAAAPSEAETPKKLTGYGVTGDDLVLSELSGNEEEEYDEFDGDMDTTSDDSLRSSSSGIESSPPSSPTISSQPDGKPTTCEETLAKPTDSGSKPEVICIDDEEPKRETARARMPSIPSLVNRTQVHPLRNEAEDAEAAPASGNAAQPICIDAEEDRDETGSDNGENEISQHDDRSYESDDSMSDADQSSDDEDMEQEDVDENLDEELEALDESDDEDMEEDKIATLMEPYQKDAPQKGVEVCSMPDVVNQKSHSAMLSSNSLNRILHPHLPGGLREAPQALPSIEHYGKYANERHSTSSYNFWDTFSRSFISPPPPAAPQLPHFMSQKKDFFAARVHNQAEAQRHQAELPALNHNNNQNISCWPNSSRAAAVDPWCLPADAGVPQADPEYNNGVSTLVPPYETMDKQGEKKTTLATPAVSAADTTTKEKKTEDQSNAPNSNHGQMGVEGDHNEETSVWQNATKRLSEPTFEFVNDDGAEATVDSPWSSEQKIAFDHDVSESQTESTTYESSGLSSFLVSPPPSEKEVVNEAPEAAPESAAPSRKRKLERMVHVEVPVNGEDFQRGAYEEVSEPPERSPRPTKRARTPRTDRGGTRMVGYAATFLGGLVVGGASLFAALVATAAE